MSVSPILSSLRDHPLLRRLCLRWRADLTGLENVLLSDNSKMTELEIDMTYMSGPSMGWTRVLHMSGPSKGWTRVLRALRRHPPLTSHSPSWVYAAFILVVTS
jgi:hypothetical protein